MALFLPSLKQFGHLNALHLTLCSVGSRKTSSNHDFGSQAWNLFAPNLTIYGFDADADACEAANADLEARQVNWTERHFPSAIADHIGEATLYVTHDPQCSSLYPPNAPYLHRFASIKDLVELEFTVELETTTLDAALADIGHPTADFLQIDVQGANLKVLQGAKNLLAHSVLAIQIEVEFSPLYVNEPLFADIDIFLRSQGFMLLDLLPARIPRDFLQSTERPGQLLWADAIYVRDPVHAADTFYRQPDQILKLASIADVLGYIDYALELLEFLTQHHGTESTYNLADAIAHTLGQIPALAEAGLETLPPIQRLQPFLTQPLATFSQSASA